MIRRLSCGLLPILAAICVLTVGSATSASAQGALFLLSPFGAKAVGRGEAIVADSTLGTEGIWYNPAALARIRRKEIAFHNGANQIGNIFMLAGAVPSAVLGTLGAAAYMFDLGDQASTDQSGNTVGNITNRNYMLAASYASPVGKQLSLGVTLKYVSLSQQCSGICTNFTSQQGSSGAVDVGAQYRVRASVPVVLGLSFRNLGQPLQIKDKEQADPLPRLFQVGFSSRIPVPDLNEVGATVDLSADYGQVSGIDASFQAVGAVLGYRDEVFLSAGYKRVNGGGSGPSIGFSYQRGAIGIDVSRRFDQFSAQNPEPAPTYVALRVKF